MPYREFPDVVNKLKLFAGISSEERDRLLETGRLRHVARGEYLFLSGDPADHFYIVCQGDMQLMRETPDGKAVTIDVADRGKTIGKRDILNAFGHHTISALAASDATVLEFPAVWLKNLAAHPTIAANILFTLSQYQHMVEIESEQKSTMNVAQRVGCFLQRLCVLHGFDPRGFNLPYSKALIASRLGMSPETLSRSLGALKEHGVRVEDSRVSFCDIHAMEEFICNHCSMSGDCPTHRTLLAETN